MDKKIELQQRKIQALKIYKKGLIKKAFNGNIKLKVSNKEWQKTKIKEIFHFENGKAHEKNVVEKSEYIIINAKFISTNGKIIKYSNKLITPLRKNDIVMVMSDLPKGRALAKCYLIEEDNRYTLNQRICVLRTEENPLFYINQINRNKYFLKFDDGVNQTNLKRDEILECPIYKADLPEQKIIGELFNKVDKKIKIEGKKISQLKKLKESLLQEMFV